MPPAATRPHVPSTLYVAFELGNTEWKLAMTTRVDQAPLLVRTMPARALKTLEAELARATTHLGLAATAPVRTDRVRIQFFLGDLTNGASWEAALD